MPVDLATLVTDALRLAGCPPEGIAVFDPHAPIALSFTALPPIVIDGACAWPESIVGLSCDLGEIDHRRLESAAPEVLSTLSRRVDWAIGGSCNLVADGELVSLRAALRPEALQQAECLAAALRGFYRSAAALQRSLRG